MSKAISITPPVKPRSVSEGKKYTLMYIFSTFLILNAFLMNSFSELTYGLKNIILAPSILLSDYISIGNLGSSFLNSGFIMLVIITIAYICKTHMNGPLIAAIFTVAGFSFFGKNIYNIMSIILGVYIYSLTQREKFGKYIIISYLGTALAPVISQITYGLVDANIATIVIANITGIGIGLILPPLAGHFVKFHQGFSLYSVGFTCGIIGTFAMSFLRAIGFDHDLNSQLSSGNNKIISIVLSILFVSMLFIGFHYNGNSFHNYFRLFRHSGRLVEDFVLMDGFGISLINMGTLGLSMLCYTFLVNGEFNGPIIGGIFTVVGFGAFGKHPKNVFPVIFGVYLGTMLQAFEVNATSVILAALFGTTLAPIAGKFGALLGIIAGFLHLTLVMNLGDLHGGMNLYNNGFSGGLVAATLVPIVEAFRKDET